jgi:hypothetical protein
MNPHLGADGTSIVYIAKIDGIWSLYRNTSKLVRNIGYDPKTIDYDYAFYDTTNPRTYLIIERDPLSKKYRYRKNGELLPFLWDDVSTKVDF